MKIVIIEETVFNEMLERLADFAKRVEVLCERHRKKSIAEWLNSEDVCNILDIKPRTLQTYRETGKINFTQIDRKIYYLHSDIQDFLDDNKVNSPY